MYWHPGSVGRAAPPVLQVSNTKAGDDLCSQATVKVDQKCPCLSYLSVGFVPQFNITGGHIAYWGFESKADIVVDQLIVQQNRAAGVSVVFLVQHMGPERSKAPQVS